MTVRINAARAMTPARARSTASRRPAGVVAMLAVLAAWGLAGCGSIGERSTASAFVAPGKYRIYTCREIEEFASKLRARELELEQLMARTGQGAAGGLVNAIAYQSEYLQARGQLKAASEAAAEKNCIGQSKWSSERSVF
jgi:hypothetical protein